MLNKCYLLLSFCQRKTQRPKQLEKKKILFEKKYKEVQPQNDQPAK